MRNPTLSGAEAKVLIALMWISAFKKKRKFSVTRKQILTAACMSRAQTVSNALTGLVRQKLIVRRLRRSKFKGILISRLRITLKIPFPLFGETFSVNRVSISTRESVERDAVANAASLSSVSLGEGLMDIPKDFIRVDSVTPDMQIFHRALGHGKVVKVVKKGIYCQFAESRNVVQQVYALDPLAEN